MLEVGKICKNGYKKRIDKDCRGAKDIFKKTTEKNKSRLFKIKE